MVSLRKRSVWQKEKEKEKRWKEKMKSHLNFIIFFTFINKHKTYVLICILIKKIFSVLINKLI